MARRRRRHADRGRPQMTTTSLHGSSSSSSFVDLKKKDEKNPPRLAIASEGVGCRRRRHADGGRPQMMTTSLHGSSSSFVALKKRMQKTHPVSQLQARGWVVGWSCVRGEEEDASEPTCLVVVVVMQTEAGRR